MAAWTDDQLTQVGSAEELNIASLRSDGTLRKPVTIWVVRLDGDLYVRSVNGRTSGWFRGVQSQHKGRIRAGGVEKDVSFVEVAADDEINDRIDSVYSAKYSRYAKSIIASITSDKARSATIRLVP